MNKKIRNGEDIKNKGESGTNNQKGAVGISKHSKPKHKKDDSDGAKRNTTKKQANSI